MRTFADWWPHSDGPEDSLNIERVCPTASLPYRWPLLDSVMQETRIIMIIVYAGTAAWSLAGGNPRTIQGIRIYCSSQGPNI